MKLYKTYRDWNCYYDCPDGSYLNHRLGIRIKEIFFGFCWTTHDLEWLTKMENFDYRMEWND